MKVVNLTILLITCVILAACSISQTAQGVEGIDTPVEVEGISIIFTGAEFYSGPFEGMIKPTSSKHILLIVKGEVLSGDAEKLKKWNVIYSGHSPIATQVTTFTVADNAKEYSFTWYFSVPEGKLLPVYLPDGQAIDLSAFQTVEP